MVALFWIVVEPLRGGVSVEEVSPWGRPWGFMSRLCIQTCVTEEQPYETCVSTSPRWAPFGSLGPLFPTLHLSLPAGKLSLPHAMEKRSFSM